VVQGINPHRQERQGENHEPEGDAAGVQKMAGHCAAWSAGSVAHFMANAILDHNPGQRVRLASGGMSRLFASCRLSSACSLLILMI
jgi:hypothetical protein